MTFLYDLTMPEILRRILAALIHAGLQGGLLALLLRIAGDRRAAENGRMTFNPFNHVLLSGIFLTVAFRMNWLEPLPFAPGRRWAERLRPLAALLVSFAVLLALVPLLDLARAPLHEILPRTAGYAVLSTIDTLQIVLVGSVCLGLLPLPGMLLGSALPPMFPVIEKRYRKAAGIGRALVAMLLIIGWFPNVAPLVALLRVV
ncbi:hypothetical protein [Chelativorans sp. J32]|uniref:hypothetical protein n=1 Tax=Chelativorans sp. J32 TaxID=935840 RepID=UPI0004805F43|nr:hypothetical protein [Chelativorans sp. J32]